MPVQEEQGQRKDALRLHQSTAEEELGDRSAGGRPGSEDGHELRQTKDVAIAAPTPPSTSPLREGAGLKCQEDATAQESRAA
jgi:hypothetical protein